MLNCIIFLFFLSILSVDYTSTKRCPGFHNAMYKSHHFLGGVIIDALDLNWQLFSVDSAKIITGIAPFFITARMIDEDFQSNFYNPKCHKNKNQLPQNCHKAAQAGVSIPMVFLSSLWIWGWNEDIKYTGRMTAIGLPFVHSGKNIIKKVESRCCLRPWHEDFSKEKRASGGFPSGHMANVTFLATLWGLRHGPRWAIPLALFAGFVFADFVNCNRHYISQLIAGAGFGVLYAVAANKVIEKRLSNDLSIGFSFNEHGGASMCVGYRF